MELWLMEHGEWLFFGLIILCFGGLMLMQFITNKAPEYTANAVVDSHRMTPGRYHGKWSSGWNNQITFRLNDGDTLTLYTSQQDFMSLKDGQSVTIRWQNENLLDYE